MATYATVVYVTGMVIGLVGQIAALLCALIAASSGSGFLIAFILYLLVSAAWSLLIGIPAVLIACLIRWIVCA